MKASWIDRERQRDAERERELEKNRVVYISSDLYPGGEFVPELEARITIFDRGYTLGDNVYEYARTYRHKTFQIEEHMKRLYTSLKVLRIDPGITEEEFCKLCVEVTRRNEPFLIEDEEYNIVWEVTRGEWGWHGRRAPAPSGAGKPTMIIKNNSNNQRLCAQTFFTGVHVVTPPSRHVPPQSWDPKIKTYSRLNYVLAWLEASVVDPKAIAIMLDHYGNLSEAVGANVWLAQDNVLMTPTDKNVLRGQTRNNVIHLAEKLGIRVVMRDLQPWHLYNCDEAFLSTTSPGPLRPISRFNGAHIGKELPGPLTKKLAKAWSEWVGIDITGMYRLDEAEIEELQEERKRLDEERARLAHVAF